MVDATAALTAQNWWYLATRLTSPAGSSEKRTKLRTRSRNRAGSKTPRTSTSSWGRSVTTTRPSIVFHGVKCSKPALNAPMTACSPSAATHTTLGGNIEGMSAR